MGVKFGAAISLAISSPIPILHYAISRILSVSAKPKVIGINARRIVASMTNYKSIRNVPFEYSERNAMRFLQ